MDLVIKSHPLKKTENYKERQDIFSTFSFYHRAAVKQEHYMKTFHKTFGDRCGIHHYVAAPPNVAGVALKYPEMDKQSYFFKGAQV